MMHDHYQDQAAAEESFFEEALASDPGGTKALDVLPALAALEAELSGNETPGGLNPQLLEAAGIEAELLLAEDALGEGCGCSDTLDPADEASFDDDDLILADLSDGDLEGDFERSDSDQLLDIARNNPGLKITVSF